MRTRIAALSLVTAALACGGEQTSARTPPIASQAPPDAPRAYRCPAGTVRKSDAVCEATTPLVAPGAPKVTVFEKCTYSDDVASIAPPDGPPIETVKCGKREAVEFRVAPGRYKFTYRTYVSDVFVTGDEERVDLDKAQGAYAGGFTSRRWVALDYAIDARYGNREMSHTWTTLDATAKDGVLDVTLAQMKPGATVVDQVVLEDDGERIAPEGADADMLGEADGRGVIVPEGKKIALRFRVGSRAVSAKPRVHLRGHAMPYGATPQLFAVDTFSNDPSACPSGARADVKGCEAIEPVFRAGDAPVKTTFACFAKEHGVLPIARVPSPLDAATRLRLYEDAKAEQGNGRAAVVPCGSDVTVDLIPGAYSTFQKVESTHQYLAKANAVVYVLPQTPQRFELEHQLTTHCPRVSSWNASAGTFLETIEIATQQDAREKRVTDVRRLKAFAQDGVVTLRVSEAEPEDAYVDELRVEWNGHILLPREGGARSALARADGRVLHLSENRQVTVTYALPERVNGEVDLTVVAFAHYIRK